MKTTRTVVAPGINTVRCSSCKTGTVMVSVTMNTMARLRCGGSKPIGAKCSNGHRQQVTITAWPPIQLKKNYSRM